MGIFEKYDGQGWQCKNGTIHYDVNFIIKHIYKVDELLQFLVTNWLKYISNVKKEKCLCIWNCQTNLSKERMTCQCIGLDVLSRELETSAEVDLEAAGANKLNMGQGLKRITFYNQR